MSATITSGLDRFAKDFQYDAYAHQLAFHASPARHRVGGGAAGPGKTFMLIMDHMLSCAEFGQQEAPEVHTLLLRRTHPKLAATVITRFREKIPRELYKDYNESKCVVTWLNGATTQFGAMQFEHDVWGWQGQWYKIGYDELTEFTFPQWQNISAWNRCPVSPHATKDGATNPIGVGARWVEDLFIKRRPCAEMDTNQRARYNPRDYAYFPATYLDNPIYADDPTYIANLDSYQGPISQALKMGIWGIAGGYFEGAWDEAYNVYPAESVVINPRWRKWLGGDWGFDHNSAIHWFAMDYQGIVRIYRELIVNRHTAEQLAEAIVKHSIGPDENLEDYEFFSLAHDTFAQRQDNNPIAHRIGTVLRKNGLPWPTQSTKDKRGREQILYDKLRERVPTGETVNDEPAMVARLQIADCCPDLIATIAQAPRDEKNSEEIAEFLGDDSLQSSGYGLYAMFGAPAQKPFQERVTERVVKYAQEHNMEVEDLTPQARYLLSIQAEHLERKRHQPVRRRWRPGMRRS